MILQNIEKLIQELISEKAFPVLAKVDKIDTEEYNCDCIELTNELEETETIYTRVKIPKMWGAEKSGIWMSPSQGAIVLLNFLNGDRNYPIITAIMGSEHKEEAPEDTLLIKCGDNIIQLDDKILLQVKDTKLTIEESQIMIETKDGASINLGEAIAMKSKNNATIDMSNKIEMKAGGGEVVVDTAEIKMTAGGGEVVVGPKIGIKGSAGDLKSIIEGIARTGSQITTVGAPAPHVLNPAQITLFTELSIKVPLVLK